VTPARSPPPSTSRLSLLLPWLILATTLGMTWAVYDHERAVARKETRAQLDFALRETVSRIEQRVAAYEQLLRGVQGLFATTPLANRSAFRDYVATLQLDANLSGIEVLGVVADVPGPDRAAHMRTMARLGGADYAIRPPGERERYAPIIQREPYDAHDPVHLGQDAWADPVRRRAMEQARDSGMTAITGKLPIGTLSGERTGFAMYLPVFAPDQLHDTLSQRHAALLGWVYAPIHMDNFMASLYGKQAPGITLTLYDDADPSPATLLYQSRDVDGHVLATDPGSPTAREYMVVAGHNWTMDLGLQEDFEGLRGRDVASVIAVTGVGLSLTLALLSWFMVTGRARALRLAAQMTEELRHMAQHDPLTDLPNRAMFSHRLQHELERAKRNQGRCALIFLDLDHFKPINDRHGHGVGDRLLQQVARRLQGAVRASDTVGRIGGDEFVVLMPELGPADTALLLAEKIRQVVRESYTMDGHTLTISCSLGVAVYPDDGLDEIALTKSADEAMYRAKAEGRDSVASAS